MNALSKGRRPRVDSRVVFVGLLTALVAVVIAVLASLGYAAAGGAAAASAQYQYQEPSQDFVAGSGKISFQNFPNPGDTAVEQYIVSAHSGPAGEDPDGQITFHSPFLASSQAKADVTCMVVSGNHAVVGGIYEEPVSYLGVMIRWIVLVIDDNGSPGQATDRMNSVVFIDRPRPPGFSPCNFDLPTDYAVEQGNFTVKDSVERALNHIR
jgi:hypothetical protein